MAAAPNAWKMDPISCLIKKCQETPLPSYPAVPLQWSPLQPIPNIRVDHECRWSVASVMAPSPRKVLHVVGSGWPRAGAKPESWALMSSLLPRQKKKATRVAPDGIRKSFGLFPFSLAVVGAGSVQSINRTFAAEAKQCRHRPGSGTLPGD